MMRSRAVTFAATTVPSPPRARVLAVALVLAGLFAAAAAHAVAARSSSVARRIVVSGVRTKRYCELLLVHNSSRGLLADVYNTFGHNTCPESRWRALDMTAIAHANHDIVALRNGPRFWLMDQIQKVQQGREVIKDFGGLRMTEEATVSVGQLRATPFTVHRVDRSTEFDYKRGSTVYELLAPHGAQWVMQSWSEQVDSSLTPSGLAHLAPRLTLPAGWHYRVRKLSRPVRIVTVRTAAQVLQDNFDNTYSRVR